MTSRAGGGGGISPFQGCSNRFGRYAGLAPWAFESRPIRDCRVDCVGDAVLVQKQIALRGHARCSVPGMLTGRPISAGFWTTVFLGDRLDPATRPSTDAGNPL